MYGSIMLISGLILFSLKISLHWLFILMTSLLMPAFQAFNVAPHLNKEDILNSPSTFINLEMMLGYLCCTSLSTLWKYLLSSPTDIGLFFSFGKREPDNIPFFFNDWIIQTNYILILCSSSLSNASGWQNYFSLTCPLNLSHNIRGHMWMIHTMQTYSNNNKHLLSVLWIFALHIVLQSTHLLWYMPLLPLPVGGRDSFLVPLNSPPISP